MTHNYAGRATMYVEENPDLKVYPLNYVPDSRSKESWTNGTKAYTKEGRCAGWFFPPRLRNKGHHTRSGPKPRQTRGIAIQEEE